MKYQHILPSLQSFTAESLSNFACMEKEMKDKGISCEEISSQTGLGITTVRRLVSQRMFPSMSVYNKLARVLGWEELRKARMKKEEK